MVPANYLEFTDLTKVSIDLKSALLNSEAGCSVNPVTKERILGFNLGVYSGSGVDGLGVGVGVGGLTGFIGVTPVIILTVLPGLTGVTGVEWGGGAW